MKKKIFQIKKSKSKKKLVCLTAYSKPIAKVLDKYCDMILVGDSIATAFYGMENTKKITLQTMINHSIAVKKGIKKSLLVVDMPINTYKNSIQAKKNAKKIFKNVRCDAVKIESNGKNFNIIKDLVKSGMPVMGHIGFTPQYKKKFKPYGLKKDEEKKLIEESKNIQKAGAFSLVLECIAEKTAKNITRAIRIPTIGIGSSKYCDGQILVTDDLLGLTDTKVKFVKKYVNLKSNVRNAVKKFKSDVKSGSYPSAKYSY